MHTLRKLTSHVPDGSWIHRALRRLTPFASSLLWMLALAFLSLARPTARNENGMQDNSPIGHSAVVDDHEVRDASLERDPNFHGALPAPAGSGSPDTLRAGGFCSQRIHSRSPSGMLIRSHISSRLPPGVYSAASQWEHNPAVENGMELTKHNHYLPGCHGLKTQQVGLDAAVM